MSEDAPEATGRLSLDDVKALQGDFAFVDLMTRPSGIPGFNEILLQRRELTRLYIYKEPNHPRPHFHLIYKRKEYAASYAIDDLSLLAGAMPAKYSQALLDWATPRQGALHAAWNAVQAGQHPRLELVAEGDEH